METRSHIMSFFLTQADVNALDGSGKTSLHYCSENQTVEIAQLLLQASPELVNKSDNEGYSALHLTVIAGNIALIHFLIAENADITAVDGEGHTMVHWATGMYLYLSYTHIRTYLYAALIIIVVSDHHHKFIRNLSVTNLLQQLFWRCVLL